KAANKKNSVYLWGNTAAKKMMEWPAAPTPTPATPPKTASGGSIPATIVDNNGFPVKGVTVSFTSRTKPAEMTNGGQAVTNEQGKATVTYTNTRAPIESGARPDTVEASPEKGRPTLSKSNNVNADATTAHHT
ncbi:Ig-like domain-containing protein, partial [Escherichia coli]|uniref:Ig-like domain-containing protein n=1 Tax=Escherichia coli TaxID=562 RepID=UPI00214FEF39